MILTAAAAMFLAGITAFGQAAGAGAAAGDATAAAAPSTQPVAGGENKDDTTAKDDMAQIGNMTPEELQALIQKSALTRLSAERLQVVAELRENIMFDDAKKDSAIKSLQDKPANTQKDNIERICKAYSGVDERFDKAYKLYTAKKYAEAAEAFKKFANAKEVSYFAAARGYLLGDSLYQAGVANLGTADANKELAARKTVWEAVDAYRDMLEAMPDRVSFSASAAINCAEAYERLGRGMYALDMYAFCAKNFALTLDKEQVDSILTKVDKLQEIYKDPMLSISKMMGDVTKRLEKVDSGKDTQKTEDQIVSVLGDLIKTTEEKQNAQQKPSPQKGKKPGEGQKPGEGDKPGQGNKPGQGKSGQKPNGTQRPSSPAQVSALPDAGSSGRTPKGTDIRENLTEKGDWAELAPREKEKIMDAAKKAMSERHRDIVRDYFLRMAEEENSK